MWTAKKPEDVFFLLLPTKTFGSGKMSFPSFHH